MQSITRGRPNADEYMSYFAGYIGRVPDGDILTILQTQLDTTHALLAPVSRAQALARPTPADWNILEVLGHINRWRASVCLSGAADRARRRHPARRLRTRRLRPHGAQLRPHAG